MPKVRVNNIALHYERIGNDGPEIVFVHGLATSLAFWYFSTASQLAQDFSVTIYDLRGHGQSEMPPSGYTTADMASDLQKLIDYLGIKQAHLVGHSFGGAVALHYATLFPERVDSLTLADARIPSLQPKQRALDWPMRDRWESKLKELGTLNLLRNEDIGHHFLERLAETKLQGSPNGAIAGRVSRFSRRSDAAAARWLQLLQSTTARMDLGMIAGLTIEKISRLSLPVLAVYGEFSTCLPSCDALQSYLPNCRTVIVPKLGHFHPITRPNFFVSHLRRFLNEVIS